MKKRIATSIFAAVAAFGSGAIARAQFPRPVPPYPDCICSNYWDCNFPMLHLSDKKNPDCPHMQRLMRGGK